MERNMLELPPMSPDDETTNASAEVPYVLPKHVRFARSLALVSGAVIGLAAGAAVFASGCGQSCNGICGAFGVQGVQSFDAQYDTPVSHPDAHADAVVDAGAQERPSDGHAGGGPRPAPRLPADWLA
jgi:hypothetical protein